jgi:HD superfamily phosphohydrolase
MEIRDPIHGGIRTTGAEARVIESPWFQRLRGILQLGFTSLTFPGATHTRFLHSVGVMHVAGQAFDSAFDDAPWLVGRQRARFRQVVRLAGLLHDIGHPPLSHTSELLFPAVRALGLPCFDGADSEAQAAHEHYTLKLLLDSPLTALIRDAFVDLAIEPAYVAALLHPSVRVDDGFFEVGDHDLRPILSQLISSELDADRMDYLPRDSYFTGASYGRFDSDWLLSHLTHHVDDEGGMHLAIDGRALLTFEDFLLSRYHMFLMVYLHNRTVCYDQLLRRFYGEHKGEVEVPVDPHAWVGFDDHAVYRTLRSHERKSPWAARILQGRPWPLLAERSPLAADEPTHELARALDEAGTDHLRMTSRGRVSRYHGLYGAGRPSRHTPTIFVIARPRHGKAKAITLASATRLFDRYAEPAELDRIYVAEGDVEASAALLARLRDPLGLEPTEETT